MSMPVFLSWSGSVSCAIAGELNDWLPQVIQTVEPFFSKDQEKGVVWFDELNHELRKSAVGIVCVTPGNMGEQWIAYETGGIAGALERRRCCPILFGGLKSSDVKGPLSHYQHTVFESSDMRKLIQTINKTAGDGGFDETRVLRNFDKWWPDLEGTIGKIIDKGETPPPADRTERDILEEILEGVRLLRRDTTPKNASAKRGRLLMFSARKRINLADAALLVGDLGTARRHLDRCVELATPWTHDVDTFADEARKILTQAWDMQESLRPTVEAEIEQRADRAAPDDEPVD